MPVQDLCTRKAAAHVLRAVHIQKIWRVFLVLSVPSPGPVTLQGSGKPYLVMTNSLGDLELASVIYNQAVLANPHPSHCHCFNPCMEPHCNLGEVAANRTYVNGNIFYRF